MPQSGKVSKAPEGFYTAREAIKRLNMPAATFHHYVRTGKIKKKTPVGHKEGYYEKSYIDKMAQASGLYAIQYAENASVFRVATQDDAVGIYDVIVSLWGTLNATTPETRVSWYMVNPQIDYVIEQEGIIVGFVNIRPLRHEALERLMAEEINPKDLKPEDILPFTPHIPLECEVGIGVRAGVHEHTKYGMRLIAGSLDVLKNFAKKGVFIKRFYTQSSTPDGIRIARGLGFDDITPFSKKSSRQFLLETETSESVFAKEYMALLKQYNKAR